MKFYATLDNWVVLDEYYKPFYKGQKTALCFKLSDFNDFSTGESNLYLRHLSNSVYEFTGKVIWPGYIDENFNTIGFMDMYVIDIGMMKFCALNSNNTRNDLVGKYITGKAEIKVDNSIWAGVAGKNASAPNILTPVEVISIKVLKPDLHIKPIDIDEEISFMDLDFDPESYSENDLIEIDNLKDLYSLGGVILIEFRLMDEMTN
jgi:hypothetical protein